MANSKTGVIFVKKDFRIRIEDSFGKNNLAITVKKVRSITSRIDEHWLKLVPCSIDVVVVGTALQNVPECTKGFMANLSRVRFETMQATIVNETIWLHHNPQYDPDGSIFILEFLTMVGYAICHSPVFSCHLDRTFNASRILQDKYRIFACNFPYMLFPRGRVRLSEKIPPTFNKMLELEKIVKILP